MSIGDDLTDLNSLAAEDPILRNLARIMRDGKGASLDAAVAEVCQLVSDRSRVEEAADRIRQLNKQIQSAQTPISVVAGNIESWYSGPRDEDRNWSAIVEILRSEGWNDDMLRDLDDSSTKVVANLPNPTDSGSYQCRGLVLGYVQSGKTTNFTAVIAKAADAGYRLFIVLSGIHDALRQQTQDRLNEQIWEPHSGMWHRLTNEDDFKPTDNVDALLTTQDQRVLAIVKKNGPRLRALKRWLFEARPELLAECPVLIIDDEADQATVNTAKPDRQPTTINKLIREIVNGVPKSAYVGYTATPFANVLIDPQDYEDLYPRDFIVDLPRPGVYIGTEAIFGREPLDFDEDEDTDDGYDFVRSVDSHEIDELRPKGAAKRHEFEPRITDSLDTALRYFLLSTSARRIRAKGNPHATALVHTSQHIDVHERTAEAIKNHLKWLGTKISEGDAALLQALEHQWRDECQKVGAGEFGLETVPWSAVSDELLAVAHAAEVITDNSRSTERLIFDDHNPRIIVAVGGNTLSRGLTLEGLAVSFFVRTASAYDTLLQMGRWFGYRNGYADLTRIWMTDEMRAWFHHLATVEQEIRYDVARLETEHLTPEQFGVRIRTHPKLAITAAAKMQHARRAQVSYAGRRIQTILFEHKDQDWLSENIEAARALINASDGCVRRQESAGLTVIRGVDIEHIIGFLATYKFHENSRDLDGDLISRYILARREEGELPFFNIAVMGRTSDSNYLGELDLGLKNPTRCINRSRLNVVGGSTYADIKALMSRNDRVIDLEHLPPEETAAAVSPKRLAELRSLPKYGGAGSGLLLLYPISRDSKPVRDSVKQTRQPLDAVQHVLGVALAFPDTQSSSSSVDYLTADVAAMAGVEVEAPDDNDVLDEQDVTTG